MHYLLFYDVVDDYVNRRAPYRAMHIALARQAVARGELVLGGALADPPDGAVLVFRGSSPQVAESFAKNDPYVKNGLVTKWRVREWTTVVGPGAEAPLPNTP
ncbi:MAG TPA: YciI-like protein [Vicinamibacterales bacterium]